jgi:glycosyltransferase involved in cell wall biosynthesis
VTARPVFILANNIEELGGVQRVVRLLAEGFASRGHDVELIGINHADEPLPMSESSTYKTSTLHESSLPKEWQPRRLRDHLDLPKQRMRLRRRRQVATANRLLSEKFRRARSGVIITAQIYAMEQLLEVDTGNLLVIGQYHDSYAAATSSNNHRRAMLAYRDVDAFLLLTERDAALFEKDGLNNVHAMRNPLSFFPPEPSPLTDKVVLSLGRYDDQKALDKMIDAWAIVTQDHPDWHLKMFGNGPRREELAQHIVDRGVTETAHLMGPTSDAKAALLGSSVYAMSSRHEGLPMVLTEAMACGVPCVSFDCAPGIRAIIEDEKDGLVVPAGDVEALAAGISRLIEDETLRRELGAEARRSVERYRLDTVIDDWEQLIEILER